MDQQPHERSTICGEKNFFRMSDRQKTATKKQFLSVSMSASRRRAEEALNTKRLSITAENSGIIEIPVPTLEGMFKKSADTTNDEWLTWKIPAPEDANNGSSSKSTFLVHSKSSHEPHRVTVSTNGRVQCVKAYVNWCTYSLCSHSLAVAEKNVMLKAFN